MSTMMQQFLIFAAVCAGLFAWGLFAKERESEAKEEHIKEPLTARQPDTVFQEAAHV
jgi:hypothetical protein